MTFYGRCNELEALEDAPASPDYEFFVTYGRCHVGKTELFKRFCIGRRHICFPAAQEVEQRQREKFIELVADYFADRIPRIDGWVDAFDYLIEENDSLPTHVASTFEDICQEAIWEITDNDTSYLVGEHPLNFYL